MRRARGRGTVLAASAGIAALLLAGCARPGAHPPAAPETTSLSGDLVVLAAASLQTAFSELGAVLEQEHPGLTVAFSFGASSSLARQVAAGAPADVLATASTATMADAGERAADPRRFARNALVLAVPAGNPGGVTGLAHLADPDLLVALCAPEVPCGAVAEQVLAAAGVVAAPDTYEKDVTATLTKVVLGEVDAALVYRTDVLAAGDAVQGITVPEADAATTDYPVAVLRDAGHPAAARAFVDLVLSEPGQAVLAAAGFDGP
jgi:molybdate transport system substrate-binding protein